MSESTEREIGWSIYKKPSVLSAHTWVVVMGFSRGAFRHEHCSFPDGGLEKG